jgi:hypothetical protein
MWGSVPARSLRARTLILCLAISLAGALPLSARGQAEPRLADAERMIQEQDYSGALRMLAALQRDHPEMRDETERLISRVIIVSGQEYNRVLAALIDAIYVQEDEEKAAALIAELQRIDPARALREGYNGTEFVRFQKLMNNAASLASTGKIREALSLYLLPLSDPKKAGFTMHKPDFEAAGYGQLVISNVNEAVSRLVAAGSHQVDAFDAIAGAPAAFESLLAGSATEGSTAGFDAVMAPLWGAARAETAVNRIAAFFSEMRRSVRNTSGKGRDDPYLQYLVWLCAGRENKTEGIAWAIDQLWKVRAQSAAEKAAADSSSAFRAARALYEAGKLADADAAFTDAYYRSVVAVKASALAGAGIPLSASAGWSFPVAHAQTLWMLLSRASAAQETAAEVGAFRTLIGFRRELAAMPAAKLDDPVDKARAAEEEAQLAAARAALEAMTGHALRERDDWRSRADAWTQKARAATALAPLAQSALGIADLFDAFASGEPRQRDLSFALRLAKIGGRDFQDRLASSVDMIKRGKDLKDGTRSGEIPAEHVGLLERHPDFAVPLFLDAGARLDSLIEDIGSLELRIQGEKAYITASVGIAALQKGTGGSPGYDDLLRSAQEERRALDRLSADAEKQMDDAAVASREGDTWFAAAQNSLSKRDPDGAISFLDKALDAYVKSQSIATTVHAAARTDKDIPDLQKKIADLKSSIAGANAQKAITAINLKFNARDYLGASDSLDAAERDWSQTQEGTYPLFDNLRLNIQNALQLSAGRDISRLDPKADVVNTFIKYAQDSLAAGRLADAEANVNDALAVAPNYGAAKVLELMIKKQTDPVAFQNDASAQIATYMKMAKETTNPAGQKTAYLALLDYARLDPKFSAQTKAAIQELEYELKLRRRPANPQQIAEANQLVRRAAQVQQLATQEAYREALDLLKQALQLNPDSAAAVRLDSDIRTRMGSTALAALSTSDTQKYKQALSLYIAGAYQEAYDIVQELWNDARSPRNKTYDPLKKLLKRCEVALNIS